MFAGQVFRDWMINDRDTNKMNKTQQTSLLLHHFSQSKCLHVGKIFGCFGRPTLLFKTPTIAPSKPRFDPEIMIVSTPLIQQPVCLHTSHEYVKGDTKTKFLQWHAIAPNAQLPRIIVPETEPYISARDKYRVWKY